MGGNTKQIAQKIVGEPIGKGIFRNVNSMKVEELPGLARNIKDAVCARWNGASLKAMDGVIEKVYDFARMNAPDITNNKNANFLKLVGGLRTAKKEMIAEKMGEVVEELVSEDFTNIEQKFSFIKKHDEIFMQEFDRAFSGQEIESKMIKKIIKQLHAQRYYKWSSRPEYLKHLDKKLFDARFKGVGNKLINDPASMTTFQWKFVNDHANDFTKMLHVKFRNFLEFKQSLARVQMADGYRKAPRFTQSLQRVVNADEERYARRESALIGKIIKAEVGVHFSEEDRSFLSDPENINRVQNEVYKRFKAFDLEIKLDPYGEICVDKLVQKVKDGKNEKIKGIVEKLFKDNDLEITREEFDFINQNTRLFQNALNEHCGEGDVIVLKGLQTAKEYLQKFKNTGSRYQHSKASPVVTTIQSKIEQLEQQQPNVRQPLCVGGLN